MSYRTLIVAFAVGSVLVYFATRSDGQVIANGPCSQAVKPLPNFNGSLMDGIWYTLWGTTADYAGVQCAKVNWTILANRTLFQSQTAMINGYPRSGVSFINEVTPGVIQNENGIYSVLGADYANWAIIYRCLDLDNGTSHRDSGSVIGRGLTLDYASEVAVTNVLTAQGVPPGDIRKDIQKGCSL